MHTNPVLGLFGKTDDLSFMPGDRNLVPTQSHYASATPILDLYFDLCSGLLFK